MKRIIPNLLLLLKIQKKQVKLNTTLKRHSWNIIKMIQIFVASVVYNLNSLRQEKRILQGILQYKLKNIYIESLRIIRI